MALSAEKQLEMLRTMQTIRRFEERASEDYIGGAIYGVVHCYIGEEAVATGICSALNIDDLEIDDDPTAPLIIRGLTRDDIMTYNKNLDADRKKRVEEFGEEKPVKPASVEHLKVGGHLVVSSPQEDPLSWRVVKILHKKYKKLTLLKIF